MTQEDKELLLKDLCARLPYETMFYSNSNGDECLLSIDLEYCKINELYTIEQIKPYFRPMSSMTEEECKELGELPAIINNISETFPNTPYYIEVARVEQINWLLEHHLDFMGLIPKGLAIEVTEENNPYEN